MSRITRLLEAGRALDTKVLGRPVPDDRPLWARRLSRESGVSTPRGRLATALVVAAIFIVHATVPQPYQIWIIVGLVVLLLVIQVYDTRRASAEYWSRREGEH